MTGLSFRHNQKIDRWENQDDDQDPISHNMLKVLQSKIINSAKPNDNKQKKSIAPRLPLNQRPATVRVRPDSSEKIDDGLESFPTIDICSDRQITDRLKISNKDYITSSQFQLQKEALKFKSQHFQDIKYKAAKDQLKLKQKQFFSIRDKYSENKTKLKEKCQELQMKKQALIFDHYNSLKNKKFYNVNNFHEMQIKLRKQRIKSNNSTQGNRNKLQIFIQFNQKSNQLRINKKKSKGKQNLNQFVLQKFHETHYKKILKKNSCIQKNKTNEKKQQDIFADGHLAEAASKINHLH